MKVILIADVKKVGLKGSVITVADGYAMNVLFPRKLAVPATGDNLKRHEQGVREAQGRADASAAAARQALAQIDGKTVPLKAAASASGTLFKSLHASDIVAAIKKDLQVTLPESALMLEQPIKKTGTYEVPVALSGAKAKVEILVG